MGVNQGMEHLMLVGQSAHLLVRALADAQVTLKEHEPAVSIIQRMAGMTSHNTPLRAPHHTVSVAGMQGLFRSGYNVTPGELSLAHGGTLCLEEAEKFGARVLDAVETALRSGEVVLEGARGTKVILPAKFRLVIITKPSEVEKLEPFQRYCRVVEEPEIAKMIVDLNS